MKLSKEFKKWFKIAIKMKKKGNIEEPYASLFDYYIDLVPDTPELKHASLSHFVYLEFHKNLDTLDKVVENLNIVLPQGLKDNFNKSLEKFNAITDMDADENIDLFEEEDDYVIDNSEQIENLLKNYFMLLD